MTSLRSVFNQFTPELQIRYGNAFEVLVKFGIFTGKSSTSTNKKNLVVLLSKIMPLNQSAIYVWNMPVSSSAIPNNIRVYLTQFTIYKSTIWMILLSIQAYQAMWVMSKWASFFFPTPSHFWWWIFNFKPIISTDSSSIPTKYLSSCSKTALQDGGWSMGGGTTT